MSLTELQARGLACRLQLHGAALEVRYSRVPGVRGIPVMPDPTGDSMRSISKPESGSGSSLRTLTWPRFVVFRGDQRHSYKNVGTELAIAYSVVAFSPG